jgi:flavodoxin
MVTDKKILVAYYSKTGHTEKVARDIASAFGADFEKIIDKKKRTGIWGWIMGGRDAMKKRRADIGELQKDPANYDVVIMGSPVWSWNATPAINSYIDKTKGKIKNAVFFITSGSTEAAKIVPYLEEISGKKALAYVGFNENELANEKVYNEKLNNFLRAVK